MKSINEVIETGIVFRPASKPKEDDGKVKTKAKKKKYITGARFWLSQTEGQVPPETSQPTQEVGRPALTPRDTYPSNTRRSVKGFAIFSHPYPPIAL